MRRTTAELVPLAGAVLLLGATGGLFWWDASGQSSRRPVPELRLDAVEQDGRIRVDWDPSDPAVKRATSATLTARDGDVSHQYPVNAQALQSGGLDYLRRSNDVLLTLRMNDTGAQAAVRTVVPRMEQPVVATHSSRTATRARKR